MTSARHLDDRPGSGHAARTALRWTLGIAVAALVHAGVAWAVVRWRSAEAPPSEPPPAVMIDLAPVAVAPKADVPDVAPGPQSAEARPAPAAEQADKIVEAAGPHPTPDPPERPVSESDAAVAKPESAPPPPAAAAVTREQTPPPAPDDTPPLPALEPLPEVAQALPQEKADVTLPPPAAPSEPPKPAEPAPARAAEASPTPKPPDPSPVPNVTADASEAKAVAPPPKAPPPKPSSEEKKAKARNVARTAVEKPEEKPQNRQASAPPKSSASQTAAAAPAASAGVAPSTALASWKGELIAHLNRFKRFPPGAAEGGTASVAFTINRAGAVLSARLIASAGDPALDAEAVALVHRASPVPAPPPDFGRAGAITLTVPIRFNK